MSGMGNRGKKLKVITGILLCLLIVFILFILFKAFAKNFTEEAEQIQEGDLSRYQWMEMLCGQTGMTAHDSQEPYFKDVSEDDAYYNYIQAAAEWGIVEKASRFHGEEYASGRFIALTVMRVIGEDRVQDYLDKKDEITETDYLDCAIELDLIQEDELNRSFSQERAREVLNRLSELYYGVFWQDDMEQVEYAKDVVVLSSGSILQANEDVSEVSIAAETLSQVEEGKIIVFDYGNTGLKIARRITGIGAEGTLQLDDDIELNEILGSLAVSDISEVSMADILNYYQLSRSAAAMEMRHDASNARNAVSPVFSSEAECKGFKVTLSTEEDGDKKKLKVSVTDNGSGVSYVLPIEKEIDKDSEYQADLDVDKIFVATKLEYSAADGVKYAEVALDAHTAFEGGILASSSENKILLCETPVPLGSGIVGVRLQLYLVISAEGTVTLKAEIPMSVCVRYEKGKGVRSVAQDISVEKPELKANADVSLMLRGESVLVLFMAINVLDAEADIGVAANAQLTVRQNTMDCLDISAAFPVAMCYICGDDDANTIVGALGLSGEWELISADSAPFQMGLHYEAYSDGTAQSVEECTYQKQDEVTKNEEQRETELNHTYVTQFGETNAVTYPAFAFDYPDGWTITKEEVDSGEEKVTLSNDAGATVTFWYFGVMRDLTGPTNTIREINVTRSSDSQFVPGYVQATDYSDLGEFMVAEIETTGEYFVPDGGTYSDAHSGWIRYALLPESQAGSTQECIIIGLPTLSFWYGGHISFIACPCQGEFTEQEKQEVVAILSSFRLADAS